MNKGLLYLLSDIKLLERAHVKQARDGQTVLRGICPLHEGADNPTAFVVTSDKWFCHSAGCHREYGSNLEGLMVGLADKHGGGLLPFREAKQWVGRNSGKLRELFSDWRGKERSSTCSTLLDSRFPCSRLAIIDALFIPSLFFQDRGFKPSTLARYDIGDPRPKKMFQRQNGYTIIPFYSSDGNECVGYAARLFSGDGPRCTLSAGFPLRHQLFNLQFAAQALLKTGRLIIVEGIPDVLRCVEAGFDETVAVLGSAIYDEQYEQISKLRPREVVILSDNDDAGDKLAKQISDRFPGSRRLNLPAGFKDIDQLGTRAREFLTTDLSCSRI